jgi:hypothetical protein
MAGILTYSSQSLIFLYIVQSFEKYKHEIKNMNTQKYIAAYM